VFVSTFFFSAIKQRVLSPPTSRLYSHFLPSLIEVQDTRLLFFATVLTGDRPLFACFPQEEVVCPIMFAWRLLRPQHRHEINIFIN